MKKVFDKYNLNSRSKNRIWEFCSYKKEYDKVLCELMAGEHGFNTFLSFNEISNVIVGAQDYYKIYSKIKKKVFVILLSDKYFYDEQQNTIGKPMFSSSTPGMNCEVCFFNPCLCNT